ncbi:unnamed protein product [Urochloa humidicola]
MLCRIDFFRHTRRWAHVSHGKKKNFFPVPYLFARGGLSRSHRRMTSSTPGSPPAGFSRLCYTRCPRLSSSASTQLGRRLPELAAQEVRHHSPQLVPCPCCICRHPLSAMRPCARDRGQGGDHVRARSSSAESRRGNYGRWHKCNASSVGGCRPGWHGRTGTTSKWLKTAELATCSTLAAGSSAGPFEHANQKQQQANSNQKKQQARRHAPAGLARPPRRGRTTATRSSRWSLAPRPRAAGRSRGPFTLAGQRIVVVAGRQGAGPCAVAAACQASPCVGSISRGSGRGGGGMRGGRREGEAVRRRRPGAPGTALPPHRPEARVVVGEMRGGRRRRRGGGEERARAAGGD